MNEANITAELRDIKPLMDIPDSSYYIYWGLMAFGILLALGLLVWSLQYLWNNRQINLEKKYLDLLKEIDWKESKEASYQATQYARLLATDENKLLLFEVLEEKLVAYKYKKSVEAIDEETMKLFNEYIEVCNGSI
jgi:hypothetical protein